MLNTLRTRPLIILLILIFVVMLIQTSWTGDDAYITMRTAENFVHGYGLRWNIDERVQTFTNPLWMFLLAATSLLVRDPYLTLLTLSIAISTVTFTLLLLLVPRSNFSLLLAGMLILFSKAYIDFSTSGLENPASHLLLLGFALSVLAPHPLDGKRIFITSLFAGLTMFNRMDTVLFVLPALAWIFWQKRSRRTLALITAGMSPFLLWAIFSVIYYGFLLPNTYYAKLNTGAPLDAMLFQGLLYFVNSLSWNPITLVATFAALGFAFVNKENTPEKLLALGICLYLGYVLYVGGDFMSGRFFTAPFMLAVVLIIRHVENASAMERWAWVILVFALGWVLAPVKSRDDPLTTLADASSGIADEMAGYYPYTNLRFLSRENPLPNHTWRDTAEEFRASGAHVSFATAIGMLGVYGGPQLHIIDLLALGDPLLARLPAKELEYWRSGHFTRDIPEGYPETVLDGRNQIKNPSLAVYYDKLHLIISGPIWSAERWQAIWMMNTGQYEYLINEYVKETTGE